MYMVGFLIYVFVCGALAWWLAKPLTRRAKAPWVRSSVAGVLMPVVFLLPFADEVVGYFQFERLCDDAKEAKVHGSIPAGEDLYTPDGKWRIGLHEGQFDQRMKDWDRARKALDTYVRLDPGFDRVEEVPAAISIQMREERLFDAKTGRLLAEWRTYSKGSGWARRVVPLGEFSARVCGPELRQIQLTILKFTKTQEATK